MPSPFFLLLLPFFFVASFPFFLLLLPSFSVAPFFFFASFFGVSPVGAFFRFPPVLWVWPVALSALFFVVFRSCPVAVGSRFLPFLSSGLAFSACPFSRAFAAPRLLLPGFSWPVEPPWGGGGRTASGAAGAGSLEPWVSFAEAAVSPSCGAVLLCLLAGPPSCFPCRFSRAFRSAFAGLPGPRLPSMESKADDCRYAARKVDWSHGSATWSCA